MQISSATGSPSVTAAQTITPAKPAATSAAPVQSSQAPNSTYSTSVGGKSYAGNVTQSDGLYEISVPNMPGSGVSASSLQGAENALNARIDLLA